MNAHPIKWTVWNANGPVRETMTHLVDDENNDGYNRGPKVTLCGQRLGDDTEWGGRYVECKRCERKAEKMGLEVASHWE